MKKGLFILAIGLVSMTEAQENQLSIGFHLVENQNDFGTGIQVTTPYFFDESVAVRIRSSLMWLQHADQDEESTWSSYNNLSIGMIGVTGHLSDFASIYSEGGIFFLFPSEVFSSSNSEIGGYGLLGIEFQTLGPVSYFLEAGAIGIGATANKLDFAPIYSNGFTVKTGLRFGL